MKRSTLYIYKHLRSTPFRSISAVAVLLVLLMASVGSPGTPGAQAATGDFSIDFVTAEPLSYPHDTGGGAYDIRNIGTDVVESLEGGEFACGDIVTYFAAVTVDDGTTDGPQTIEMDFSFLMDTTGQSGVAIGDIVRVQVNYDPIVDLIPGEDNIDQGIIDDGGSVATLTAEWTTGPIFTAGSELWGTAELTDLDAGEQVVVRIDVELFCDPGSAPTGNLAAALEAARLTFINDTTPVSPPQAIPGGSQTIPFKLASQVLFPGLNLFKSVSLDGTCPGVETLTVPAGTTVYYCFQIHNNGEAELLNISLDDPMFGGDIIDLLEGFSYIDDGSVPDLAPGAYADNYANPLAYIADQDILNTATADGEGVDPDTASCSVFVYSADFGDLPVAYGLTKFSDDGARHSIGNVFLGSVIDSEADGWESGTANGDDEDGEVNDEDGIVRPTGSNWSDGSGEVLATLSDYGCLTAWLDFTDGAVFGPDGSFDDSFDGIDELIIENQLLNPGETEVQFDLPPGAANNNAVFFARFRLVPALDDGDPYCGDPPALTGFQEGGEVEDYAFVFGPTSITLTEFDASPNSGIPTIWLAALALLGIALLGLGITRKLQPEYVD
jgi:hypothetical protein